MSSATPMMRQYLEIKADYPDAILFFRLGDFYEMFLDDAVTASRVLDITLTSRNKGAAEEVPLCGIPYHSCQPYIAKLVENGFKVAICEQVEDPKAAKGIVRREVVRVVTPGLILDTDILEPKENNFLLAIAAGADGRFGVASLDITTGEFRTTEVEGLDGVRSELASAVALNSMTFNLARAFGPAAAAQPGKCTKLMAKPVGTKITAALRKCTPLAATAGKGGGTYTSSGVPSRTPNITIKWAAGKGFSHLRVDGLFTPTTEWPRLDRFREHSIELPVGRLAVVPEAEGELRELLGRALDYGKGVVQVAPAAGGAPVGERDEPWFVCRGTVTASPGVGCGPVFAVAAAIDLLRFPQGAVLVVEHPLPDWAPLLARAAARGGRGRRARWSRSARASRCRCARAIR